jgi:endoglucanase
MSQPRASRRAILINSLTAGCAISLWRPERLLAKETLEGRDLTKDKRPVLHADGPKFGAYDPHGDFKDDSRLATEHLFLPWEDVDLKPLRTADEYASARGRNVLVTIEPWSWALDWNVSRAELRDLILSGKRDANMRAILKEISGFKSPVTIRWAQEMENPWGRFIWSSWKPKDYIEAYRRMIGIVRDMLPKAQVMWSPRGENNLVDYYPGNEQVDIVGLTVFGLDRFDIIEHQKPRTFAESLKQGYDLVVGYGKPIWVAELGYEGSPEYLASWAQDVTANYPQYAELKEVIYFNDKDVWRWPHNLGLPDWRVVPHEPTYPVRRK